MMPENFICEGNIIESTFTYQKGRGYGMDCRLLRKRETGLFYGKDYCSYGNSFESYSGLMYAAQVHHRALVKRTVTTQPRFEKYFC